MSRKIASQWVCYLAVAALALGMQGHRASASQLLPPGFRPLPLGTHALTGGRIVIRPGEILTNGTLVIRQAIDDWTPEDKQKCRLKEYQGMVAIYIGPDAEHDILMKVTAIRFDSLPVSIKEAIRNGEYEFQNEAEVNDALENLDEYF